ncbi:hypothetical protein EX86_14785, partial [Staphylococcus aureus]
MFIGNHNPPNTAKPIVTILVIFMVGHFYKGVAMSAVQWLESGIFLWLGASLLITFGILFSL